MKFVAFLFLIVAAGATPYPELQLTSQLRDINIVRSGSDLQLAGRRWTVGGGNIYWLGLDENVIPPPGQPFYAPTNASYPTKGRTTEIMNTLNTMGARAFRCHTCGVSVGNPLSIWPTLGETNEQAFETIDWAVFQARSHGLRLFAPLTDNYVRHTKLRFKAGFAADTRPRTTTTAANACFFAGAESTSPASAM
jgi:hypothetical protein